MRKIARWISEHTYWFAIPIVLLLVFPSAWSWLGWLGALALFLVRWLGRGSPFPVTRINSPLLIFLAMVAASFAMTPAPDLAVATASQVVAGVIVFFGLVDYRQAGRPAWHLAAGLVLLGVAFALAAPFTVNWTPSKLFGLPEFYDQIWPRLSEKTNSNILAGALASIVPIALALVRQSERRGRILGAISLAPILIILALLQSRGAIFGLVVGLVIWVALYNRWILPLVPLGLLFFLVLSGSSSDVSWTGLVYDATNSSLFQRQDLWTQSVFLIRQSPLGVGLGFFPRLVPGEPDHAHNLFFQIALDTGVVGLAAFIGIWLVAIRSAWQNYRAGADPHLAIGVLAAFVVLLVHGLGDVIVWGTAKSSFILWTLLAIAVTRDEDARVQSG